MTAEIEYDVDEKIEVKASDIVYLVLKIYRKGGN